MESGENIADDSQGKKDDKSSGKENEGRTQKKETGKDVEEKLMSATKNSEGNSERNTDGNTERSTEGDTEGNTGNTDACRICLRGPIDAGIGSKSEPLIAPCNCRDIFAHVHASCLAQWLEATGHQFCDICRFKFIAVSEKKSLMDWFKEEEEGTDFFLVAVCFLLLMFIILVAFVTFYVSLGRFFCN